MNNKLKAMRAYFVKQRESRKILERLLESDPNYLAAEIEMADADLVIDQTNHQNI